MYRTVNKIENDFLTDISKLKKNWPKEIFSNKTLTMPKYIWILVCKNWLIDQIVIKKIQNFEPSLMTKSCYVNNIGLIRFKNIGHGVYRL